MKPLVTAATVAALGLSTPAKAEEEPKPPTQLELVQAQRDLEKARADLARAQADRITALGLPSFEGKTTLSGDKAGAMEAEMLSATALRYAATMIAASPDVKDKKVILLTQSDTTDYSRHVVAKTQLEFLSRQLEALKPDSRGLPLAGIVAMIQAGAGLLRSESTLTGVAATSLDDETILWLTAGKLKAVAKEAIIPSANISGAFGKEGTDFITTFDTLVGEIDEAKKRLRGLEADLAKARQAKDQDQIDALQKNVDAHKVTIERADAFVTSMTTAGADKLVPLVVAARHIDLMADNPLVLRLNVNKAGGSLVNTKNLTTTFGVDPLKVSGAVLVSYLLSDPGTGQTKAAGMVVCQTSLVSIRKVQENRWRPQKQDENGSQGRTTPPTANEMCTMD
jgi:hypothetical protein